MISKENQKIKINMVKLKTFIEERIILYKNCSCISCRDKFCLLKEIEKKFL